MPLGVVAVRGRLAPVPAGYPALDAHSKKLTQAKKGYLFEGLSRKQKNRMSVLNAVVVFGFLQFLAERSKEFPFPCEVVAGPLARGWEDEWALTPLLFFGGGAPNFAWGEQSMLRKSERLTAPWGIRGKTCD